MFWSIFSSSSEGNESVSRTAVKWNCVTSGFSPKSMLSSRGTSVNALPRVVSPVSGSRTAPTVILEELKPERLSAYCMVMSFSGNDMVYTSYCWLVGMKFCPRLSSMYTQEERHAARKQHAVIVLSGDKPV